MKPHLPIALFLTGILCLSFGSAQSSLFTMAYSWLFNSPLLDLETDTLILKLRATRLIVALLCGASLATAGVLSQAIFKNPLASPSIIGTDGGASLGAIFAYFYLAKDTHFWSLPLCSFLGSSIISSVLLYQISKITFFDSDKILLLGFAISVLTSSLGSLLTSFGMENEAGRVEGIFRWLLGSFADCQLSHMLYALPLLIIGGLLTVKLTPSLDILVLGNDVAQSLGVLPRKIQRQGILAISMLVAYSTTIAGPLPFIGLLIPHLGRFLVGPSHPPLITVCLYLGMIFAMGTDLLARTLRAPMEIEVGILFSFFGAFFFAYLIWKKIHASNPC